MQYQMSVSLGSDMSLLHWALYFTGKFKAQYTSVQSETVYMLQISAQIMQLTKKWQQNYK